MTTKPLSFTTLSMTAVTITASLSLIQTLSSAQEVTPNGTSVYTEASYLMGSSIGVPCIGVLPEVQI